MAAGDRHGPFAAIGIIKRHRACFGIDLLHRHIKYLACFRMDRQENRIGLLAFFAQAFQHHRHDIVIAFCHPHQGSVELPGFIKRRCRIKFMLEAKRVKKAPQHGIVMITKTIMGAKRVGNRGQGFA